METSDEFLFRKTRAALIVQGSSLAEFATTLGCSRQYISAVLKGKTNGPRAVYLRKKVVADLLNESTK